MRTWKTLAWDLLWQACYDHENDRLCHEGLGVHEEAVNMFIDLGWLKVEDDSCGFVCSVPEETWTAIAKEGE